MCTKCWVHIDENDLKLPFCPYCHEELVTTGSYLYGIKTHCQCHAEIEVGDVYCVFCGKIYYDYEWEEWLEDNGHDPNGHNWLSPLKLSYEHTICCGKLESACTCEQKIPFEDIYSIDGDWQIYEDDKDSLCASCVHQYSVGCIPLRVWARKVIQDKVYPGDIAPCQNFLDEEDAPDVIIERRIEDLLGPEFTEF